MSLIDPLEYLLSDVAETLDVPPSAYEQAEERYRAVGTWLCAEGSSIQDEAPEVYSQGSFRLGTVVRPLAGDDYDLDAVVQLSGPKAAWDPSDLKEAVGNRLKAHEAYQRMLEPEGRRCWTLRYASERDRHGFHLDLLPSVLADHVGTEHAVVKQTPTALAITNRVSPHFFEWRDSDPKGYADWFFERNKVRSRRAAVLSGVVAGVEPVRRFTHREPLQRAIQLLKRYRDVMFRDNDEHAPISVIITTLGAQAYGGEESLLETLFGVVNRMSNFIQVDGTTVQITNPVNPSENFADRWQNDVRKAKAFLSWLEAAKRLESDLRSLPPEKLGATLNKLLGDDSSRLVMERYAARQRPSQSAPSGMSTVLRQVVAGASNASAGLRGALSTVAALLRDAPHRRAPPWPMAFDNTSVKIRGHVTSGHGVRCGEFHPGARILPQAKLRFDAEIRGGSYTEIYWQITNTGEDAERARGLRGQFEKGGVQKVETSLYLGDHSIECFVVRNNMCVARSGQFVVSIRC